MDIYQWAEAYGYSADFHDVNSGRIFKCQEYGEIRKHDPNAKIRVVDDFTHETIGYASRKEN